MPEMGKTGLVLKFISQHALWRYARTDVQNPSNMLSCEMISFAVASRASYFIYLITGQNTIIKRRNKRKQILHLNTLIQLS